MSYIDAPTRTFPTDGATAFAPFTRVKLAAGVIAVAGLADADVGVTEFRILAADKSGTVRLTSAGGTQKMIAAAAITAGAKVYTAAAGRVSSTAAATGFFRGIAVTAAGAANDVVEVIPTMGGTAVP